MSEKIKAILFDLDGVILKPRDKYFSEKYAEEQNVPIENIIPFFKNEYKKIMLGQADLKEVLSKYQLPGPLICKLRFKPQRESSLSG